VVRRGVLRDELDVGVAAPAGRERDRGERRRLVLERRDGDVVHVPALRDREDLHRRAGTAVGGRGRAVRLPRDERGAVGELRDVRVRALRAAERLARVARGRHVVADLRAGHGARVRVEVDPRLPVVRAEREEREF
jgi:hypothetical protein